MKKLPEKNTTDVLIKTLMGCPPLRSSFVATATALACFGLLSLAQAVSPPPDGGYANFTTAEGQNALFGLTTGVANTAVGSFSLESIATGSFNTAVGAGTLLFNNAESNTAIGTAALLLNTDGNSNTAVGVGALENNTASGNTAIGFNTLLNNTTGGTLGNTLGFDVGPNVAVGQQALENNTIAGGNTAVGYQALGSNTTGIQDTDLGISTAVGFQALANASGPDAGANDAFGYQTLFSLSSGGSDVAIGANALHDLVSGDANTAVGAGAGGNLTSGDSNVFIGQGAGSDVTNASNVICIGAAGNNVNGSCFIDHIFNGTSSGGVAVFVNSNGRLGTSTSSRRFKEDIKPMGSASEAILALRPVTFHYKRELDADRIPQFGLVAEEVEKVNPDLIVRDKDGKPYSVRYDQVNAMLLNEFIKEHKKVQELEAMVTRQQKSFARQQAQIETLGSRLQKVSTQIEINRTAPQMVLNNP
ncbi:MAG TPA: tail fiber domain-containing protein [Candidatus Udaeobacter sp.]|nr:tail fiber domain-containing protein [Candidatus Udaeobacter sp.]